MHAYKSTNSQSSSTFIVTRSGGLYAVKSIASSLPLYDIVLYDIANSSEKALRSAPVALHPPPHGAEQSLFSVTEEKWRTTKVIGYKDPRGNDAEVSRVALDAVPMADRPLHLHQPGTYDELNSIVRPQLVLYKVLSADRGFAFSQ